jgi:hypothetical protein
MWMQPLESRGYLLPFKSCFNIWLDHSHIAFRNDGMVESVKGGRTNGQPLQLCQYLIPF